jgi:hypothetical protein
MAGGTMTDYERIKREYDLSLLQKDRLMNKVYPVGSIYLSLDPTDPATRFGGVWERIENAFLLAASTVHPAGESGGEEKHTLTVDEIPPHTHSVHYGIDTGRPGFAATVISDASYTANLVNSAGGGQPHNNMPPYLSVYMWTRIK